MSKAAKILRAYDCDVQNKNRIFKILHYEKSVNQYKFQITIKL